MNPVGVRNRLLELARAVWADLTHLCADRSRERFFCLSSGNCGSQYLVALLRANGAKGCWHEKPPSLDDEGVAYWLDGGPGLQTPRTRQTRRIRRTLGRTRRSVWLESSNRLFSLAPLLAEVFPGARFIHLHRDPWEVMNSTLNKSIWPAVLDWPRLRYRSRLTGDPADDPFDRTCVYWANINRRILDDLADRESLSLRFEDLVRGDLDPLEAFLGRPLPVRRIDPVNTKDRIKLAEKRFASPRDWPEEYHRTFRERCGALADALGYPEPS